VGLLAEVFDGEHVREEAFDDTVGLERVARARTIPSSVSWTPLYFVFSEPAVFELPDHLVGARGTDAEGVGDRPGRGGTVFLLLYDVYRLEVLVCSVHGFPPSALVAGSIPGSSSLHDRRHLADPSASSSRIACSSSRSSARSIVNSASESSIASMRSS